MQKAIQELYPENFSHCYGCGPNNKDGHHVKSYPDEDGTIARFTPKPEHIAMEGVVYGGVIASVLDCHGCGSAAIFICQELRISMDATVPVRCVTASLKVDFKAPTPTGAELVLRGKLRKIEGRKVWVDLSLSADGMVTATGEILSIRLKEE